MKRKPHIQGMLFVCGLLLVGCAGKTERSPEVDSNWFVDETLKRGVEFRHQSGADGEFNMPEIMGGGGALLDVDTDGDLDLYLVQSGSLTRPDAQYPDALYINDGKGFFVLSDTKVASQNLSYGMGVIAGDYDNDQDVDLYITNLGANELLRNDGKGRFEEVSATSGVEGTAWSTGATFADFDRDGDLDLFVVNYLRWTIGVESECLHGTFNTREYCPPNEYNRPSQDRLYRNNGDGTFTDVTSDAGIERALGNGLGVVAEDFNQDGLIDIFVANDVLPNHLWLNQGELRFTEQAHAWGCAVDEHGMVKAGMGVVTEDFDEDQDMDILVVNLVTETDTLFMNAGTHFLDETVRTGLSTTSLRHTRFGLIAADFNNDSLLDLYEANGAIAQAAEFVAGRRYGEPNVIYEGKSQGKFELKSEQTTVDTSRGALVGDLDGDGRLDIVVVNNNEPVTILMNQTPVKQWVSFRVLNKLGRVDVGATLSARLGERRLMRTVRRDGSYLSSKDPNVHIGLGDDDRITNVEVEFSDGSRHVFGDFSSNNLWQLEQPR